MNNFLRWVAVSAAFVVGACAAPLPTADSQTARSQAAGEFKTHIAALPDSARVYILPTLSKGMFTDPEGRAGFAIFHDGSEKGAPLGWTARTTFVAFDIAPGTYDLMAYADGAFTKFTKSLTFEAGAVYFYRPAFFRSAKELAPAGSSLAAQGNSMGFDPVASAIGGSEIQSMDMAALKPEGQTFLAQARVRPIPAQYAYPPPQYIPAASPPAPAPAAVATPAPAAADATFRVVEQKLKDLRRLRQEGLITKDEYDAKRRTILDVY